MIWQTISDFHSAQLPSVYGEETRWSMVCHIFSEKYDQEFYWGHIGGCLGKANAKRGDLVSRRFSTHSWRCKVRWTMIHPVDVKQHKLFIQWHWSQWHCQNLGHTVTLSKWICKNFTTTFLQAGLNSPQLDCYWRWNRVLNAFWWRKTSIETSNKDILGCEHTPTWE